ncbi:MAG TPA: alpha/beta hydrolase [Actinocatenispora sp.]
MVSRTASLTTAYGASLEYLTVGTGAPVTLFVHGLAGGIPDTRPLGSAVEGTKVFVHQRGHGGSTATPGRWGYAELARDVAAVADEVGATRALGVSLGAGALCRLLVDDPDRFERLVFFLPAVLDTPRAGPSRDRMVALARAAATGDAELAGRIIGAEVPTDFRDTPPARTFVAQRVGALLGPGLGDSLTALPDDVPLPAGVGALGAVTAPALVLGCEGDPAHPAEMTRALAAALPHARAHVYPEPGVLWTHRADLRGRISTFLNAS